MATRASAPGDAPGARDVQRRARMLGAFPAGHVLRVMDDYVRHYADFAQGRAVQARAIAPSILALFESDEGVAALTPVGSKALAGGILTGIAHQSIAFDDFDVEVWARRLEGTGLTFYAGMATRVRHLHHMLRGHAREAARYEEALEREAMAGGTTWQEAILSPLVASLHAARCRDATTLKAQNVRLRTQGERVASLAWFSRFLDAEFLLLSGDTAGALALLGEPSPVSGPHGSTIWFYVEGLRARALVAEGEFDAAAEVLGAARNELEEELLTQGLVALDLDLPAIELIFARGDAAEAFRMCDAMLEYHRGRLTISVARLHRLGCDLSLRARDLATFEPHMKGFHAAALELGDPVLLEQSKDLASERARLSS